ncbi:alpha/beta hydrolase [Kutzneria viridogrisea]|uniref:Pimeloyl-ACP methyl ester carboxylesterase n=1 Tax=Kutzneria viridogrisea TaxID=47990 RepID=A0ABR6BDQ2_9PSEU|nr:pimeloyl-ACP methyl ester carboxylesterase [Kutzneria viridogrisea]
MRRFTSRVALILSALVVLSLGGAAAVPAPVEPPWQATEAQTAAVRWTPCPQDAAVQCTTVAMPVDWAQPDGPSFPLAVARRRATDLARRVGVLVLNPGGPGGSGVDFAVGADQRLDPELLERFDIIGFDPRGIGESSPVRCSQDLLGRVPTETVGDQAGFDRLAAYNRELRADCRKLTGPLFDHVDTLSVARDVDSLRQALGEDKISYFGQSYGTLIGQQYAEQFGGHIRTMVLDGNMDHSLDARGYLATGAAAVEDSLHEFAAWCARDAKCPLRGQNVMSLWDSYASAAERGALTDSVTGDSQSLSDLVSHTYGSLSGNDWAELSSWLAGLRATPAPAEPEPQETEPTPPGALRPTPPSAVICEDWRLRPHNYAELQQLAQAERQAAPHARYSDENRNNLLSCVGWPDQVVNPEHPLRFAADTPRVLLVNGLHDPTTGYQWAQDVHRQTADKTTLLTYEGWGHVAYWRSGCVRASVDSYLVDGTLPTDLRCPAEFREP